MSKAYRTTVGKRTGFTYILIYPGVKVVTASSSNVPETLISVCVCIVKMNFSFDIFLTQVNL